MGTLRKLLWFFVFCAALAETEARATGCSTNPWGHYRCPDGYYWHGHHDRGWADYHAWRRYHGWGHRHWGWRHERQWAYYRPSLYRDYYAYAVIGGVAIRSIVRSGASALPAQDTACDKARSDLSIVDEKLRLRPDAVPLRIAADGAQREVMDKCVPPWMQRAAGLERTKKPTPDTAAAL